MELNVKAAEYLYYHHTPSIPNAESLCASMKKFPFYIPSGAALMLLEGSTPEAAEAFEYYLDMQDAELAEEIKNKRKREEEQENNCGGVTAFAPPGSSVGASDAEQTFRKTHHSLTKKVLQQQAVDAGLLRSGSKVELIDRLWRFEAKKNSNGSSHQAESSAAMREKNPEGRDAKMSAGPPLLPQVTQSVRSTLPVAPFPIHALEPSRTRSRVEVSDFSQLQKKQRERSLTPPPPLPQSTSCTVDPQIVPLLIIDERERTATRRGSKRSSSDTIELFGLQKTLLEKRMERETRSGKDRSLLVQAIVRNQTLPTSDFLLGYQRGMEPNECNTFIFPFLIERKSVADLCSSIVSSHLLDQKETMSEIQQGSSSSQGSAHQQWKLILILEGNPANDVSSQEEWKRVMSAVESLAIRNNFAVVHTPSMEETASFLFELLLQLFRSHFEPKPGAIISCGIPLPSFIEAVKDLRNAVNRQTLFPRMLCNLHRCSAASAVTIADFVGCPLQALLDAVRGVGVLSDAKALQGLPKGVAPSALVFKRVLLAEQYL